MRQNRALSLVVKKKEKKIENEVEATKLEAVTTTDTRVDLDTDRHVA